MPLIGTDMTLFYRALVNVDAEAAGTADDATLMAPLTIAYYDPAQITDDISAWERGRGLLCPGLAGTRRDHERRQPQIRVA